MKASGFSTPSRSAARLASLAAVLLALGWAGSAAAADCLETAFGNSTNCTANDFAISSITVGNIDSNDCGGPTDSFQFDGTINVDTGSATRYDVGFYISNNSDQALTGTECSVQIIPQGTGTVDDGDVCGDYDGAAVAVPVNNVNVKCRDNDNDGFFDLALCTAWHQNGSPSCDSAAEAIAGTASKCECTFVNTDVEIPHCDTNADCATHDDNNVCTDPICIGLNQPGADSFGCGFQNNTAPCDDNLFCNGTDVCAAGSCGHSGDPCAANGECNDLCSEANDNCVDPNGTPCSSDSNVCTDDECDGAGVCAHNPNTDPCASDGEVCTTDVCAGGSCTHPPDDGGPCADDGNVCTSEICAGGSCTHPANSDPCNDNDFCTDNDVCSGGVCDGDPHDCSDAVGCTNDACDSVNSECDHTAVNSNCDDQNDCTQDICSLVNDCISTDVCSVLTCRSPGYWATHSGYEKPKQESINVGQELLDVVGGVEVCGQTITATSNAAAPFLAGLGLESDLQGLCKRTKGVQQRQLYRQLVAAALNCALSGSNGNCNGALSGVMEVSYDDCSDVCAGNPPAVDPPSVGDCIHELDCFNNGGTIAGGQCVTGSCEVDVHLFCGGEAGDCPDLPDGPDDGDLPDPQPCINFPNCHANPICNDGLGFCPKKTPASSSAACKEAKFDDCTIDDCGP